MVDTARKLSDLQTLLATNGIGSIDAQDLRDMLVSTYPVYYNVKHYGATGNGSTNDTAAIQAAIDACPNGGTVFFPPGNYIVAGFVISKRIVLRGDNWNDSVLYNNSVSAHTLDFSSGYCQVLNLRFDTTVTKTGGAYIRFQNTANACVVEDVSTSGQFIGIWISSLTVWVNRVQIGQPAANSIGIYIDGGGPMWFNNIQQIANAVSGTTGMTIVNCIDAHFTDCEFMLNTSQDMLFNPGNGQTVSAIYFENSYLDGGAHQGAVGVRMFCTGTGTISGNRWTGCWMSNHTGQGVLIDGLGGGIARNHFIDCDIFGNQSDGVYIAVAATDTEFIGGVIDNNSGNGFHIAANVSYFRIIGCTIGKGLGVSSGNAGWGVQIDAGASDYYVIDDNQLDGNFGRINDLGTGIHKAVQDWSAYTPAITPTVGSITTVSATGRYRVDGKTMFYEVKITVTTNGTGAGALNLPLPTGYSFKAECNIAGRANAVSGKMVVGWGIAGSTGFLVYDYATAYPAASGEAISLSGVFEIT